MSEGTITFDESRWPIVVVTFWGAPGDAAFANLFEETERIIARGEPHILITDLSDVTDLADAKRRQQITEWTQQMEAKYGQTALSSIKVVKSPLVRGAISAVQWMRGRDHQDRWVATLAQAIEIAEQERTRLGL